MPSCEAFVIPAQAGIQWISWIPAQCRFDTRPEESGQVNTS
jgi:hypothetical protein